LKNQKQIQQTNNSIMIATNVSNQKNNEYQLKINSIQMATPKTVLEAPKRISIIDRGKSWVCAY
jgi:hypothetical protein